MIGRRPGPKTDATARIVRALIASAEKVGATLDLKSAEMTAWSSATYSGGRHMMTLTGPSSDALDAWLGALPQADLRIPQHLIVDLSVPGTVRAAGHTDVVIHALSVADA